jgi:transcriptional regulator with XRE-family HTH domain
MSEFSDELRRFMAERGIGVRELARRLPCNAGYVSNLRSGKKRPSQQTAFRLDEVLDAGGLLVALAAGAFAAHGGEDGAPLEETARLRLDTLSTAELGELIAHLGNQWHALVKTDNLLGPRHALDAVRVYLGVIAALLRTARPPIRDQVLRLGARYAESAAWLHEDAGDLTSARYWTGRSMEWAVEGGDRLMVSWALFRRGQQAMATGDPAQIAGLGAAARREARGLPGPMMAAILQQEAHAHALDGAERDCHRTLDRAQALAAEPDDPGDASNGHGSFCTPAYLEMQRGICWLVLAQPGKAVAALQTGIGSLPSVYRRDRGVGLSQQAAAFVAFGEPAEAAAAATEALGIAQDSGSGRILRMIAPVAAALEAHSQLEAVAGLRAALAETLAV